MFAAVGSHVRSRPVLVGGIVGLVVGLVGMLGLGAGDPSAAGAALGAVAGGATAALLTDDGLRADVRNAVLADLVSSALFFVGVLGWLVYEEPNATGGLAEPVSMAVVYGLFGSFVAVPIALVSLCVAAIAGAAASVALDRRRRGDAVAVDSRRK